MAEISANEHFKVPKPSKSQTKRRSGSRKKKPLNNSSIMRSIEDQENMHPNTGDVYPTFGQTPLGETRPIDLSNIKSSSPERTGEEEEQVHFSEMDVSHELIPRFNHSDISKQTISNVPEDTAQPSTSKKKQMKQQENLLRQVC